MALEEENQTEVVYNVSNTTAVGFHVKLSELFRENPLFFLLPILLIIITQIILIFLYCRRAKTKENEKSPMRNAFCSSEACVRCNKYDLVKENSIRLLRAYKLGLEDDMLKDTDSMDSSQITSNGKQNDEKISHRVLKAITEVPKYGHKERQNPNVIKIPGLTAEPFWTDDKLEAVNAMLEKNYSTILSEFLNLPNSAQWIENSTPHGSWRVMHLINQGLIQEHNCSLVPETVKLINSLPGVMKHNVFGNVGFSVVDAGTWITPHYGPCNCRIRCHLGILTSPQYHLIVDGVRRRSWRNGRCLMFDDSFLHEVRYLEDPHNESGLNERPPSSLGTITNKRDRSREGETTATTRASRVILMLDLWHPDLTHAEIDALNFIFPSSDTSYETWKTENMKLKDEVEF